MFLSAHYPSRSNLHILHTTPLYLFSGQHNLLTLHNNALRIYPKIENNFYFDANNDTSAVLSMDILKERSSPTSLYFCESSKHIYVGFSCGATSRYTANTNRNESYRNGLYRESPLFFDSATVHASPVKIMRTLDLSQPITTHKQIIASKISFLLICDESGIMSVWRTLASNNTNNDNNNRNIYDNDGEIEAPHTR